MVARTQNHNGHVFCLSLSCLASSCSLTRARNRSVLRPRAPQGPFSCCDGTRATRDEMICERRNEREETETSDMCAQTIYYFKTQSPFDSSSLVSSLSLIKDDLYSINMSTIEYTRACARERHKPPTKGITTLAPRSAPLNSPSYRLDSLLLSSLPSPLSFLCDSRREGAESLVI